nr:uncharacterized protein LOC115255660 [Aedes albopictus]
MPTSSTQEEEEGNGRDVLGEPADDEEEFASGRSDPEEEEDENDTSVESHEDTTLTENIDAVERPLNAPRGPSSTSTPIRVSSRLNKGVPPFRFRETSSLVSQQTWEPQSLAEALASPERDHWKAAMDEEYAAQQENSTWDIFA